MRAKGKYFSVRKDAAHILKNCRFVLATKLISVSIETKTIFQIELIINNDNSGH